MKPLNKTERKKLTSLLKRAIEFRQLGVGVHDWPNGASEPEIVEAWISRDFFANNDEDSVEITLDSNDLYSMIKSYEEENYN